MSCENCGEREAAIHLTQIVDNTVTTLHLCPQCAAEKGVQTGAAKAKFPLSDFLASMGKGVSAAVPAGRTSDTCEFCHASLKDFRESGRLGCPHCYQTFESHLRDLLRRLHGSSHHVGKVYLSPADSEADMRERQLVSLREQLRAAVDAENFELAAELRDRIRVFE